MGELQSELQSDLTWESCNQALHGRVAIRLYMGQLQSDFTWESLTHFGPMEFSIKLHVHTIEAGWSIAYIEGSQVMISKNIVFLSLKIDFVLVNSADPDLFVCLFCCFTSQVNSHGHGGMVSSPNHTFSGQA